ncbi:MAG: phosphatase PAP2 family protein [Chloroflexi bacterium]|nr:phosphatase PAP2 family protein [Chloroflexota bacterium]
MTFRSLLELDARLSDRLRVAEQPGLLRTLAVFFAHSGDSWFWGLGLVVLWWRGDLVWKQWAVVIFTGIVVLAALVMTIKFTVRRRRPEGEWGGIYRNADPHSFPSGHAARAFMIAVLASGLAPSWLAITLWVWAPLVSLARVAMGVHYVSDILAGIVVGIVVGLVGLQVVPAFLMWLSGLMALG